jgi:hypothetical protein
MTHTREFSPSPGGGLQTHTTARRSFFDIPVYRVSREQYEADFDQFMAELDERTGGLDSKLDREDRVLAARRRDIFRRSFGGTWQFNEIVGYVRLHFLGGQVRGELWMPERKRLVKTRTRQLAWRTFKVVPEMDLPRNPTNQEVYDTITAYLEAVRQKYARRHLDTSVFERIGPFVDWNALRAS